MDHKTSVMLGESGAGKSTLLNALIEQQVVATGDVRKGDSKGRHTTVRRELHVLPSGGVLIDTPGVRSLGLWADESSIDAAFGDIAEIATRCRFGDCAHTTEPDCAVRAAVESGLLDRGRVTAWQNLSLEVDERERRAEEHERKPTGRPAQEPSDKRSNRRRNQ